MKLGHALPGEGGCRRQARIMGVEMRRSLLKRWQLIRRLCVRGRVADRKGWYLVLGSLLPLSAT